MRRRSFASGSLSLSGGRGRIWGSGLQSGDVHSVAEGSGTCIFQPFQPLVLGASRGGLGGGFSSGAGVGVGLDTGIDSGLGSGLGVGLGAGLVSGGGIGGGAAFKAGAGFGGGTWGVPSGILGNEKFTMRILNDRLASYLKKVALLQKANAELELKISQFVDSRTSPTARDYSDSLTTINDLQATILDAVQVKGVVFLNLDNTTLDAEDFRIKYENEKALRQTVEADIAGLKRLLEDIKLNMKELTMKTDTLNDEKVYLKKNHEEEMVRTRSQMSGQIHVDVEAAPQQDLTSVLEDIRDHYNTIAAKNRRELESWFKGKLETLKQEVAASTQTIETSKTEMTTEKTRVQGLEVELQSVMAVKASLGAKLLETQSFYAAHLSGYQLQVTSLEEQLLQIRADLERQVRDYQLLLDIKTRLELEIADYRRLLDIGATGSLILSASSKTKAEQKSDETPTV